MSWIHDHTRLFLGALLGLSLIVIGGVVGYSQLSRSARSGVVSAIPQSASPEVATHPTDTPPPTTSPAIVRILFAGDMMFDRSIRERAMRSGNDSVFGPRLQALLQSEDRVVANLEGPITSQPSRSIGSAFGSAENYNFTFHPSWAQTLATRGIGIVNLGNNHILNRGEAGLAETCGYLDAAGVQYFGDPRDTSHRWLLTELQGIRIALVNDNQFMSGGHEAALADIQQARAGADIVIVYTHWGTEYVPATETQKQLAHAFIDAGADAIIGSHPHVVQEREEYQGKMIYYSLGNFIFDQYFRPETQQGLLVEMTIDPVTRKLQFRDIPIQLKTSGETELYDALKTDAIESR